MAATKPTPQSWEATSAGWTSLSELRLRCEVSMSAVGSEVVDGLTADGARCVVLGNPLRDGGLGAARAPTGTSTARGDEVVDVASGDVCLELGEREVAALLLLKPPMAMTESPLVASSRLAAPWEPKVAATQRYEPSSFSRVRTSALEVLRPPPPPPGSLPLLTPVAGVVVPELAVGRVPLDPLGRVPNDAPEDAEPVGAPLGAEPELGEVPLRVVPFAPDGAPPPPPSPPPWGPPPVTSDVTAGPADGTLPV